MFDFDERGNYSERKYADERFEDPGCPDRCENRQGCELVMGNNISVDVNSDDCEVRSDIVVNRIKSVRLWGRIRDFYGNPIENALLKLVRVFSNCGKTDYEGVAHTLSDFSGFYQFEVPRCGNGSHYRIIVGKAAVGKERTIRTGIRGNHRAYNNDYRHNHNHDHDHDHEHDHEHESDY